MSEQVPRWQQLTKYCQKHDQQYMQFLSSCPICVGEMLAGLPRTPLGGLRIPEELIPNKMYGPQEKAASAPRPAKPEQMSMF